MTWRPTNPNLRTRHGRTQQMDSSNVAGDWTQRTHDLAVDEPEPADSAWPNPADGLIDYSRRPGGQGLTEPKVANPTNPNLWTRRGRTQQMDSWTIAGDWTQRTHDLAVDEPEPADSAWPWL